jgi:hypothetical protein
MRITTLSAICSAALGGCVVYDNTCRDGEFPDGGHGWGDDTGSEVAAPEFTVTPGEIVAGTTIIGSIEADVDFDYATIAEVEFYGEIVVCTTQVREEELLITIYAPANATLGPVDLVLTFQDGQTWWLDDAMTIVGADDGGDGSGDGGSDGGTGDGGADGGSGGTGDGGAGGSGGDDAGGCG